MAFGNTSESDVDHISNFLFVQSIVALIDHKIKIHRYEDYTFGKESFALVDKDGEVVDAEYEDWDEFYTFISGYIAGKGLHMNDIITDDKIVLNRDYEHLVSRKETDDAQ